MTTVSPPPPAYPSRYPGLLCQSRSIAGVFLMTVVLIGLLRFWVADRESLTSLNTPEQPQDKELPADSTCGTGVVEKFCKLHDRFPILQERIHRRELVMFFGILLPIGIYFGRHSHLKTRYILRPYILLSGAHLAGFIISTALLGPGGTVIYSFLFSLLRAFQVLELLLLPETIGWAQKGLPSIEGGSLARRLGSILQFLAKACMELLRRPWSIAMLLFLELLLWTVNASLLGWHLVNVIRGLLPLLAEA
jgi:hypothetical protein